MIDKKKILLLLVSIILFHAFAIGQSKPVLTLDFSKLNYSHDLSFSSWGPYSKKYAGVSHINDISSGMRFDFSVLPGYYRNKTLIPNVLFESGYFPWEANQDLTQYTYRYELEWKDKVVVDVTYTVVDSFSVMANIRCINNTNLPQNLALNLMTAIDYPDNYPVNKLDHSSNSRWINAADYQSIFYAIKTPGDNLVYDGWMRGEIRGSDFIGSSAIAQGFGKYKGDQIVFKPEIAGSLQKGILTLLYKMKENTSCKFHLSGLIDASITLSGNGKLAKISLPYQISHGNHQSLVIQSQGGDPVELNGLLFSPAGEESQLAALNKEFSPQRIGDRSDRKIITKFKDIASYYGMCWDGDQDFRLREVKNDELDIFFRKLIHNHTESVLMGNDKANYTNVFIRPVELLPHSEQTVHTLLCTGNLQQVKARLQNFASLKKHVLADKKFVDKTFTSVLTQGKKYEFSQKMLRATLMNNVVYPIYTQRSFIRHLTPGKWWNSLYTWDSGFIALGLNEINLNKAAECINAYTTSEDNQSAFIHHGSPVPVQIYASLDLWNKTQSKEFLAYIYPRLKQYYEFVSGRTGSSTTRTLKSNLIKTWDYFYNSGGWDDYPPQAEVHRQKAEQFVTPVINTSQCIRVAKILRMAALALDKKTDLAMYDQDINVFTIALQKYSWNDKSGYFSYVIHDKNGNPTGTLQYENKLDYNMGLDGAYPLLAGICSKQQENILIEKIFSEKHMWTPSGIGVVDQSAPYYKTDGYWNGSVWMPHQWFMWKTMLDLGRADLAYKIAIKGLDIYKKETDESYYTFEHFLAKSGRGAGWHQFGGLSTPVISWFTAYYKPGTVTPGFEIWIKEQAFDQNNSMYKADISFDESTSPHLRSILICMNPAYSYQVTFAGKNAVVKSPYKGLLQINLPATNKAGKLEVKRS